MQAPFQHFAEGFKKLLGFCICICMHSGSVRVTFIFVPFLQRRASVVPAQDVYKGQEPHTLSLGLDFLGSACFVFWTTQINQIDTVVVVNISGFSSSWSIYPGEMGGKGG